jgi:uncharacterized membrane protein
MKNLGILLIIIGAIMMLITGFNIVTKENVVNLGPIQIDKKENHPIQWSPILGGILLVGGVAIVVNNKNK